MTGAPQRRRRRVSWKRGLVGLVSGLVAGLGAAVVVTQSGRLSVDMFTGIPLLTAGLGAVWAAVDLGNAIDRIATGLTLAMVAGSVWGAAAPVLAQDGCGMFVVADRETRVGSALVPPGDPVPLTDLAATPWIVRPHTGEVLQLVSPEPFDGRATIVVESVEPFGTAVLGGEPTVWRGALDPGAPALIEFERVDWAGVEIVGDGARVGAVPLGTIVLRAEVFGPEDQVLCGGPMTVQVRLIAGPFGNAVGQAGLVMLAVGSGLMIAAGRGRFFRDRDAEPPRPDPATAPPAEWIPTAAGAVRAPYMECRFVETGSAAPGTEPAPIPVGDSLVAGRSYDLQIEITPSLRPAEVIGDDEVPIVATGWSRHFRIDRYIDIRVLPGTSFSLRLPVTPTEPGRRSLDVNVMAEGHLLQVERIDVDVVAGVSPVAAGSGQTASTVISASDYTACDLRRRTRRAVQVILRYDPKDASIDAQFRDVDGTLLAAFDTPHPADDLRSAAEAVRSALVTALKGEPDRVGLGGRDVVAADRLTAWLPILALVGKNLHDALFPPGSATTAEQTERLRRALGTGSPIIQVNQDAAGISVTTLPWTFVYDDPLAMTATTRLCATYAGHLAGPCPDRLDPDVVCPSGFWGYRYQIEQPPAWVGRAVPPPLPNRIGSDAGPLVVNFIHDPRLANVAEHEAGLAGEGNRRIIPAASLDEVRRVWETEGPRLDLVYFYAHHGRQRYTNAGAVFLGEEALTDDHVDEWTFEWAHAPLVVLNGCDSGAYDGSTHASLLNAFRRAGASGVVGTECIVNTAMAAPFMERLLDRIAAGAPVGDALQDVRIVSLVANRSPIGLIYALFALSDLGAVARVPEAVGTS
jgi:hypothetical protein